MLFYRIYYWNFSGTYDTNWNIPTREITDWLSTLYLSTGIDDNLRKDNSLSAIKYSHLGI